MNRVELIRFSRLHKLFKPFFGVRGHALVFHRVCPDTKTVFHQNLQVSADYLETVIRYFLENRIDIISLDECYRRLTFKGNVKRFVVFTFDDGYKDNLIYALPIFEKYHVPLSIFITTGYIDRSVYFLGYILEKLVFQNTYIHYKIGSESIEYNTKTLDDKRTAFYQIRNYLRNCSQEKLPAILKNLLGTANFGDFIETNKDLMLSWQEIKELSNHPLVTIGSHTKNHPILANLTEDEVRKEIHESALMIESKSGKPVSFFAYPYGGLLEANEREYNIAKEYGLKLAFTAINGNIHRCHSEHLTSLPRIGLNKYWSTSHLDLYLNGLTPFLNKNRSSEK